MLKRESLRRAALFTSIRVQLPTATLLIVTLSHLFLSHLFSTNNLACKGNLIPGQAIETRFHRRNLFCIRCDLITLPYYRLQRKSRLSASATMESSLDVRADCSSIGTVDLMGAVRSILVNE